MANRTTHCVILRPDGGLAGLVVAGQTLDGEQWQALLGAAQARCLQIDQMDERARGVIGRTEISAAEDGVPAMAAHMLRVGSISASQMECAAFQLADGGATRGNQANVINGLADALETAYQALDDASGVVDAGEGEAITYEAELGTVLNALAQARPGHWTAKRDEFQRDLQARRDQGAGREPAAIEVGQRYVYQCAGEDRAQYNGQVTYSTPDGGSLKAGTSSEVTRLSQGPQQQAGITGYVRSESDRHVGMLLQSRPLRPTIKQVYGEKPVSLARGTDQRPAKTAP